MTYEEALKDIIESGINLGAGDYVDPEALKVAAKALEKQIPKKVEKQQWIDTVCECGRVFSKSHGDGYYSIPYENQTKYCPECGQALKWEGDECNE